MRVVYDTMLFFQVAAQQPPRLHGSFQAIDAGRLLLCMSQELFQEIADVLSRPEFLDKAPHFTPELAAQFFAKIRSVSSSLQAVPEVFTLPKPPKDDHLFKPCDRGEGGPPSDVGRKTPRLAKPALTSDGQRLETSLRSFASLRLENCLQS